MYCSQFLIHLLINEEEKAWVEEDLLSPEDAFHRQRGQPGSIDDEDVFFEEWLKQKHTGVAKVFAEAFEERDASMVEEPECWPRFDFDIRNEGNLRHAPSAAGNDNLGYYNMYLYNDDEGFDYEGLILFINRFLVRFRPDEIVTFSVGFTGRDAEPGGIAVAVSVLGYEDMGTAECENALQEKLRAELVKGKD